MPKLSAALRRQYIDDRINKDWGWSNYEKGPTGHSLNDILNALIRAYGRENVPTNTMTIMRDIDKLREIAEFPDEEELSEGQRLLEPENFAEFRTMLRGDEYQLPPHQEHLFRVLYSITHKVPIPQETIDWFDEWDPIHPFPENLNELITDQKVLVTFLFLMAPRHGKTDLLQDFGIHTHCYSPNSKILFGNGTIKKTENFIGNYFMPVLENHEEINRLYGPFKSDSRAWSKQGYVLAKREGFHKAMSMQPFGISGSILSLDADLELADDISDLRRALSETTTDDDVDWFTTQLATRREPHTALAYVGSHVVTQTGDLFERLEDRAEELNLGDQALIIKKIPAHRYELCSPEDPEHTKCVLWPEKRPYGFLEAMRGLVGDDDMFEAVYNQKPRKKEMLHFPKGNMRASYVNVEYDESTNKTPPPVKSEDHMELGVLDSARSWFEQPICCKLPTLMTMGFDPAASERKGASFSALSVRAGCPICDRRFAVDWWKDRQSPEMNPDTIGQFADAYPMLSYCNVEVNAYQKSLSRDPRMQEMEAKGTIIVKEWNTDERKHDPRMGIPVLGRAVKSGMYSIPYRTLADQEYAETIIKEYIRWPQKPNDFVMADWLAELALAELIADTKYIDQEMMPGADRWGSEWHDEQQFEVDLRDIVAS